MKGHESCPGERIDAHEFEGKTAEESLGRLGRWIDKQQRGEPLSIQFTDVNGDPMPLPPNGTVYIELAWRKLHHEVKKATK